ncbi:hypothetical protein [Dawidia soli]|uniref:Uncharacterized protein n=1 Tax=Dawidia soli TaxID=2782352 RepID=A0AAP2D583_9BACT|nr:hypothetical protein [Dawidia soli]MBT1685573.1 hypothetical protein [Dawidia soli]
MELSNTTDLWVYVVTVLFTLSVITEKLTQLVRQYPTQFKWLTLVINAFLVIALVKSWGNLDNSLIWLTILISVITVVLVIGKFWFTNPFTKEKVALVAFQNIQKNSGDKTAQEQEITLLSLLLGLVVAVIFDINLVELIQAKSDKIELTTAVPVDLTNFQFVVTSIKPMVVLGFLLTGFFLTFGSKFFHDLLDLLLEVKNQKRNLNQATKGNEAQLIRLQMDNKASLLPHADADHRKQLESEIQILKNRLTRLIAA